MNDPRQNPEYLKIGEAARFLGVTPRTIYRRIWAGSLPAAKVGGLYYIRRADLESLLASGRVNLSEERESPAALKCGACYRLLESEAQLAQARPCPEEDCVELVCTRCQAEGVRHCAQHSPDRQQRWEEAQQRWQRGELTTLVSAAAARLREASFLNRIQARLAHINTLLHPLSGEVLTIKDWDALTELGDERAEVMRLLGKVVMDQELLGRVPLNAWLRCRVGEARLSEARPGKSAAFEIQVRVLSRLPQMAREGFDSSPLCAEDLTGTLLRLSEDCQHRQCAALVLLASTTGWDDSARQVVAGGEPGSAFVHRMALFYLYDLDHGELIFNPRDDRVRRYAELFAPLLPSEELEEIIQAVQQELHTYDSLTLTFAAQKLPFAPERIRQAFEHMAAGGDYTLQEWPDLGVALVRKPRT